MHKSYYNQLMLSLIFMNSVCYNAPDLKTHFFCYLYVWIVFFIVFCWAEAVDILRWEHVICTVQICLANILIPCWWSYVCNIFCTSVRIMADSYFSLSWACWAAVCFTGAPPDVWLQGALAGVWGMECTNIRVYRWAWQTLKLMGEFVFPIILGVYHHTTNTAIPQKIQKQTQTVTNPDTDTGRGADAESTTRSARA